MYRLIGWMKGRKGRQDGGLDCRFTQSKQTGKYGRIRVCNPRLRYHRLHDSPKGSQRRLGVFHHHTYTALPDSNHG
jgi:hypothetical protein